MAGQNGAKLLETFNLISKSIPRNAWANEFNLILIDGYTTGINLTYYNNKRFQQQWDYDLIYDADTVYNNAVVIRLWRDAYFYMLFVQLLLYDLQSIYVGWIVVAISRNLQWRLCLHYI